ncbi:MULTISPECIES: DUF370 domain-containing protein [Anaerotignum]|jgi:hypothetical protein|uniref:Putative regulatory protein CPRO_22930 n=1 Tax=Anaerotignum propionicum DSM 1682 TaxID=991789 RepID=A0A0X8VDP5_ANAPI|nr:MULTISPECIES: DUF370 domain-containing protein [Anaerotignum]HBF64695.1 DUF370 domain-containing protein [Clostridium sp.]AMJ41860.1 hypothetical protein CPRO_22930 [Anaerotignum propionicum DSM 1682]MCQ4936888.1 DUF370 domain-containing protein [Anaerotignum propionicum]MEA5058324.1 DUF370 domain-containing protein [Anaerotignum propionicum]SHF04307.1 hypothetical protein SAMN02745151_02603 [[Clostridium] propionicum DSM 1682] [Anaerotignum propionicum DSM 1682]
MEKIQFLNIGYGNVVSANRVIAIVSPDSAPIKRIVQEGKEKGNLIDATYGRKTRCVIIMDNGHLVLSPNMPETVGGRLLSEQKGN